jgi:protein deglycase
MATAAARKKAGADDAPHALVPLAAGFEETEAVTIVDILRRAGMRVTVAGLAAGPVTGSHGIAMVPDTTLHATAGQRFDLIALPGGRPGADHLAADERLLALLQQADRQGAFIGAVCAGPRVLARAGLLSGRRVTSFPGALDDVEPADWDYREEPVVVDGRLVTSRGPGTAMDFALRLVEEMLGHRRRRAVESRLMRN